MAWLRASVMLGFGKSSLGPDHFGAGHHLCLRLRCMKTQGQSLCGVSATTCNELPASRWMRCLSSSPN